MPLILTAILLFVGAWLAHRWSTHLATVEVHRGRCTLVSGALPQGFLNDLGEVCRMSNYEGTITVRRGASITLSPGDPNVEQRLRNVMGTRGVSQLNSNESDWVRSAKGLGKTFAISGLISGILRRFR